MPSIFPASKDLGIDLGTVQTRIADRTGMLVDEPSAVALIINEQKIVEFGKAAHDMQGRIDPEIIEVVHPVQTGVVADYDVTAALLHYLLGHVSGPIRFIRPRVMITVPYGVTSVESRAVHEAVLQGGARDAHLIQQPLAAALGIDLPIGSPSGNMIICLGGGTTQPAVVSMYSIVSAGTMRSGGLALDEAIATYVRRKYGVIIPPNLAELLKIKIGAAVPQDHEETLEVQGQDQVSGLPRPVTLVTGEIVEALQDPLKQVIEICRSVLEKTPPELVSDIIDRGVALTGGGAQLRGMDKLLTKALGIPAYLVDNPAHCTAHGAVKALGMLNIIKRNLPAV